MPAEIRAATQQFISPESFGLFESIIVLAMVVVLWLVGFDIIYALQDYELLEVLLFAAVPRRDVKPLAKKLLAEFKSLWALVNASACGIYGDGGASGYFAPHRTGLTRYNGESQEWLCVEG